MSDIFFHQYNTLKVADNFLHWIVDELFNTIIWCALNVTLWIISKSFFKYNWYYCRVALIAFTSSNYYWEAILI